MDDVKEILKKYWPYLLGGVVGIFLILRFRGGSSSAGGSGGSDYAAFLQAQSAAAQQNAQLQAQQAQIDSQNQLARDNMQLNRDALNAEIKKNNNLFENQRMAIQADAFNNFTTAQAAMAQSVGSSTAAVIGALNQPALIAMQANAAENAAALNASANVAAASFLSQGNMVVGNAGIAGGLSQAIGQLQLPSQQQGQGKVGQALEYGGRAVAAYYTAGGSEVYRSSMQGSNALNNNQAYA